MVPVKRNEAAPKFETVAGGKALKVMFADRVDTIILKPDAGEIDVEGQKITSASALIIQRGDKKDLIDFAGK